MGVAAKARPSTESERTSRCVSDGAERVEFLGGSIEFAVKVDAQQRAARVWAAESSLGERATEKCMFDALRAVTVQTVVGTEDTATWEITIPRSSALWMDGAELQGDNRIDRITALADSFVRHGIHVQRDTVPGVAHEPFKVIEPVEAFLQQCVRRTTPVSPL